MNEVLTQPVISTCFPEKPIDFKALDGKPVFVLFLMISTSVKTHLHLLSRLSFCLRDPVVVSFLASQPDKNSMLEKIALFERIDMISKATILDQYRKELLVQTTHWA